ncbi:MAG: alpha/beta hydrolase [Pseudonocardiaceae bacterium]
MPSRPPPLRDRAPHVVAGLPYPFALSQFDHLEPAFALTPGGPVGSTDAWSGRQLARVQAGRWVPVTSGTAWHRAPRWLGTGLAYRIFPRPANETGQVQGCAPAATAADPDPLAHPALSGLPLPTNAKVETVRTNPEAPQRVAVLLRRGPARRLLCFGAGGTATLDAVVELGPWISRDELVVVREKWPGMLPARWHVETGELRPLLAQGTAVVAPVIADVQRCGEMIGFSWTSSRQPRRIELFERQEILAGPALPLRPDTPCGPVPGPARATLVAGRRSVLPCLTYEPHQRPRGTVVLLHGGPHGSHRATWSPLADSLALEGWRVVLPNIRGSGLLDPAVRPPRPARYGLDDLEDVATVISRFGTGPVVLGGPSYGGYLAARAARELPEVRAVFLLGAFLAVADLAGVAHPAVRAFLRTAGDSFVPDSPPARVPHFVAHGSEDPRIPVTAVTAHADQLVDGSEVLVIPGEGHGVQTDAAARLVFPALFTWLANHG